MSALLEGNVAVVTGGSSGNGRQISLKYAEEGADVVIADIQDEPREGGDPTHEIIESQTDSNAKFVECDVSNVDAIDAAVEAAEGFGGIDIMVNNAGIYRAENFLDVEEESYDQMMDVNVKGVFFGAQAAARRMVETDGGNIINLSSVVGLRGSPNFATYSTTKGAIRHLTYALAAELGPREISVNAIHPGIIETAMTTDDVAILGSEAEDANLDTVPLGTAGEPEDVADAALFLASDLASYVNGESLVVDGGMSNTH